MITFEYDDGTVKALIELHSATGREGLERSQMMSDARTLEDKEKTPDPVRNINRTYRVPLLTAAAVIKELKVNGEDKKFDYMLCDELPDVFLWEWEQKVYEVNPHWRFGASVEGVEELQKKVRKPTTGLSPSTKQVENKSK